jgi:hypothetical protein
MDREQKNLLQNYSIAMRQRMRGLDSSYIFVSTEQVLQTLKQLEGLARNAREKIGNLEVQTKLEI